MAKIKIYREDDEIIFEPDMTITITDKQESFILDIEKTVIVITELYKANHPHIFEKYFVQVLNLAQVGLADKSSHLDLSKNSLVQLKHEIVRIQSSKIKNDYLKKLGKVTFWYIIPCLIAFLFLYFIQYSEFKTKYDADASQWKNVFLLISSSSCGIWVSSTISKLRIEFDDLITVESNELGPHLRLIFTNILSLIFLILFLKEIVTIKIGPITSNEILNDSLTSILFGVILGLNERILGNSLIKKTSNLIK